MLLKIKEFRRIKKASQQVIGDYVGVSAKTISDYETGYSNPSIETLIKIAEYFGVSITDLIDNPNKSINEDGDKYELDEKDVIANKVVEKLMPTLKDILNRQQLIEAVLTKLLLEKE